MSDNGAKTILYFGKQAKVNCDRKCNKAWGINTRPSVKMSSDENDYAFLSDGELGDAPINPGTYEGRDAKPTSPDQFPNRWCVRECERVAFGDDPFPNFDMRVYNIPRDEASHET
jgi:hypothetical protein